MMPGLREELLRAEIAERARRTHEARRVRSGEDGGRRVAEGLRHATGAFLIRSGVRILPDSSAVRIQAAGD